MTDAQVRAQKKKKKILAETKISSGCFQWNDSGFDSSFTAAVHERRWRERVEEEVSQQSQSD